MPKLILRGAYVRHFDGRQNKEGGPFTRIHLSADFTQPICEALEWGEPQDGATRTKLKGGLSATHLILTPSGRELKQHEMQLAVQEIRDFTFIAGSTDEETGKVSSDRLDFIALSVEAGAGAKVESYIAMIGRGAGQLRVGYEEQAKMDLAESAPADDQERLISNEQAADAEGVDDDAPVIDGPTLAPRVLMEGNKRKRKSVPPRDRSKEQIADGTAPLDDEKQPVVN